MASLTDRMVGAAKLDVGVYEEVEADTGATGQAMAVVLLSSLAGGIGSIGLGAEGFGGVVVGGIAALIGWVSWAVVTYLIGTRLLAEPQTHADVGELLRTLGFAQSPGLARILGVIPILGPFVLLVVSIWMLVVGSYGHCRASGAGLYEHLASRGRVRGRLGGLARNRCCFCAALRLGRFLTPRTRRMTRSRGSSTDRWHSHQVPRSGITTSPRCSARAAWARSGRRLTPSSTARSR